MKNIKHSVLFTLLILFCLFSFAQPKANWKEMKDFHAVMSKTFHPAEEKNFQPLKDNADSLVIVAKAWQSSTVPEGYNASITKPLLESLVKQTKTVQKSVKKNKSDDELMKDITKAHDIFHEITEKCREGE
jgi:hypothetical protein